jgi:hypothetical protein
MQKNDFAPGTSLLLEQTKIILTGGINDLDDFNNSVDDNISMQQGFDDFFLLGGIQFYICQSISCSVSDI